MSTITTPTTPTAPAAPPAGAPPAPPPVPAPQPPRRRPRSGRWTDVAELVGALAGSFALTWLIFERLLPYKVLNVGFAFGWYALFLLTYWLVSRDGHGAVVARDRVMSLVVFSGGLVAFTPIVAVVGYVVYRGGKVLFPVLGDQTPTTPGGDVPKEGFNLSFFTETIDVTGPLSPPTEGGALHSIIGTLEQLGLATLIAVPLGVLTAVYLSEVKGRLTRPTRLVADAMTALPSIVAGLFIYSLLILQAGWNFSGFAGALALAVLMLPTVTIAAEQVLRVVPGGLREASLALGAPQWRTVLGVVIPTARAGLSTAVILGMARVVGETAPMLLTAFGTTTLNTNPFSGHQDNLPLFIYSQIRSSQDAQVERAWAGALVLLAVVLVLFVLARLLGRSRVAARGRRISRSAKTSPKTGAETR